MAIENGVQNAELGYILDPAFQIENLNGKPVVGGYICVYEAGTDNKYISYENFDGAQNPFKIPLKADGRAVILGDPSLTYDIYFYDSYGNQLFSRLNVQCNVPGNISIKGADTRIKNTDGTLDISLQTQANNVREYTVNTRNKLLDVQSPLYFVENSQSATIIGIKGGASGYVTKDYVDSVVSGKLDTSAFSAVSGDFLTDKFEYDDNFNITGYDGSAFASNGQTYSAGTNINITDNVISVTGLPTSSDVENAISSAVTNVENKFEYNENNYITAYNNSAFAGTNYSAGDYVSIENDTISVTGLQPSGDYATKTELESATSGKMDVTGMTAYQPSGDYATHDDLTAYQPVGDYYSASNPSGFITNDAITGLQPSGDYVTHDEMTAYQPSGNYATIEDVESAVSGKQDTLSAGEGIQIIDNTISVTAQGGSGITAVNHDNTLSGNGNSEPLGLANAEDYVKQDDLTGYQPSGDYYSASNPSGFITSDDLTGYATTSLVSSVSSELYSAISGISGDYELVAGSGVELVDDPNAKTTTINVTAEGTPVTAIQSMIDSATSGLQSELDYGYHDAAISSIDTSALYDTSAHARINTLAGRISNLSSDKLDASAFSTVSGDFLTAHQDISNLMPKSESANFYPMTGNPSGFLTEHQSLAGYLQNTDLTIVDNKITEISGVPLSAGDELPAAVSAATDYVTATSGDINSTINNVSSNSGVWGGSALPISAGPGIKVNLVNNTLVFSNDETVLWENPNGTITKDIQWPQTLSEPITNFEKVSFLYGADDYSGNAEYHTFNTYNNFNYNLVAWRCDGPANNSIFWREAKFNCNGTSLTNPYNSTINLSTAFDGFGFNTDGYNWLVKVIGINRVSGGN